MGDWTGTVPTVLAGDIPSGTDYQTMLDIETALVTAWTSYAVSWTATAVNPAIGNGNLTGVYLRVGKTVMVRIMMAAGTTTTFGTGAWLFSLPVTPQADQILCSVANDFSLSQRWAGQTWIHTASATGDNMRIIVQDNSQNVTATIPMTWATTDRLIVQGVYETT